MHQAPRIAGIAAAGLARSNRSALLLRRVQDFFRLLERGLGPFSDLSSRLVVGGVFFSSGFLKLTNWDHAILLAAYEYPVAWMNPVTAAVLGAGIEVLGALCLIFGFATRFAALPMLALALVIQFEYRMLNEHLWWSLWLGSWMLRGAGALSLDHALARGADDSVLPGGRVLARAFAWAGETLAPLLKLAIRVAAGVLLLAALPGMPPAFDALSLFDPTPLSSWFGAQTFAATAADHAPLVEAAALPPAFAFLLLLCALAFIAGLATRLAGAIVLVVLTAYAAMAGATNLQVVEAAWLASFALSFLCNGAGRWSLDAAIAMVLRRLYPQLDGAQPAINRLLPHVVIVGAGFGGLSCASALRHAACRITLIDQRNYHLFQPLLYQVATAGLSPADIAVPVRELFRNQANVTVRMARVTGIDRERREVLMSGQRLAFDYLVLATGARHSYFGKDQWEPFAPGLKQIEDATEVRRRLLLAFERAENSDDAEERRALMTFVIIGGGPTGVELAGAISELAHHGMRGEFRNIDPSQARVLLVQSAKRLLPTMHEGSSAATLKSLRSLGVEVRLEARVEHVAEDHVLVSGERIPAHSVFWAAGVTASNAADWLAAEKDSAGRVVVNDQLRVNGWENTFALGDTAASKAWNGQPVPGLAPAAQQGGQFVARTIQASLEGRAVPAPFRYRHLGSLATVGRKAAVADFGPVRLSGPLAWWFWGAIHVLFLANLRSRVAVAVEWFWAYLTFRRSTRLITESATQR